MWKSPPPLLVKDFWSFLSTFEVIFKYYHIFKIWRWCGNKLPDNDDMETSGNKFSGNDDMGGGGKDGEGGNHCEAGEGDQTEPVKHLDCYSHNQHHLHVYLWYGEKSQFAFLLDAWFIV